MGSYSRNCLASAAIPYPMNTIAHMKKMLAAAGIVVL